MGSVLRSVDIKKRYKRKPVLNGISMEVHSGEVVGLLGPNGAGKTTAFYIVVGLVRADEGQVFIDDTDLTDLSMHERARLGIGYLPQEASVFRKLTVEQNILAVLELRKGLSKGERYDKLNALLEELQIEHIRDSLGISLSGGERRRVEIARALAVEPAFILLDEPFAGVDPISVLDIQRIVSHLCQRGIGVLITDHNVRETLGICSRGYILHDGKLMAQGEPETLLNNEDVKRFYLGENFKI